METIERLEQECLTNGSLWAARRIHYLLGRVEELEAAQKEWEQAAYDQDGTMESHLAMKAAGLL